MKAPSTTVPAAPATGQVLQRAFRGAMGSVAAAVSVVTTLVDGDPRGATVSAFMSLSMDPPMIVVSLERSSRLLAGLEAGSPVGLNVLAAHQDQIALRFASRTDDKFSGIPWQLEQGAPALRDRHVWVSGRVARLVDGGDHALVLIDVVRAQAGTQAPLTYWQRTFGTHQVF